jgi:hypothetical protein
VAPPERPPLLQPLPMSQEGGVSVGSLDVPAPRFGQTRSWSRVRNKETASVAQAGRKIYGNPTHGISAEAASRDDPLGGSSRLFPPHAFVVNLPNSEVEGVRVGLFGVVRPIGDVEYVEDRVCTFTSEPDWLGAGAETRTSSISSATSRAPSTPSSPNCPAAFRRRFSPVTVAAGSLSG